VGRKPRKKGHRARSSSSDFEGDKLPRRSFICLPKYDGMSIPFMTFKAEFSNAAAYNKWSDSDQLAQLKACLTSTAANVMWDSDPTEVEDFRRLWQTLADRFGGHDLTEKYRTELRARVRQPNESLNTLYANIKKLSAMGYSGPTSAAKEAIIKDCFIEALDPDLALKLREQEVANLDQALSSALKLEAIHAAAAGRDKQTESNRHEKGRDKYARNVATGQRSDNADVSLSKFLQKLDQMQFEFKTLHDYVMSNQQQQNTVPVQAQMVNSPLAPTFLPPGASLHPADGSQQQPSPNNQTPASRPRKQGCYICNDFGHIAASCPFNEVDNQPVRYGNHPGQAAGATGPREQNNASTADTFVTRGAGTKVKDKYVYIDIIIDGKCYLALIDTGCQLNLLPSSLVGERHVQSSSEKKFAANGSLIHILGTVELSVTIGGAQFCNQDVCNSRHSGTNAFFWLAAGKPSLLGFYL